MKKCPDTHHKSRVGRVTGTTSFFLFGLIISTKDEINMSVSDILKYLYKEKNYDTQT